MTAARAAPCANFYAHEPHPWWPPRDPFAPALACPGVPAERAPRPGGPCRHCQQRTEHRPGRFGTPSRWVHLPSGRASCWPGHPQRAEPVELPGGQERLDLGSPSPAATTTDTERTIP